MLKRWLRSAGAWGSKRDGARRHAPLGVPHYEIETLERRVLLSGTTGLIYAGAALGGAIGEYTNSGGTVNASLISAPDFLDNGIAVS